MKSVSVVIPVYRAELTLVELHRQLAEELERLGIEFEIIMVEDGGGDNSWQLIGQLAARDPRVRGFKLHRNYGQHNALLCGIRAATGDIIVTMDDDLQHPVTEIRKLLECLDEGYDVVYGAPKRAQHGLLRNLATRMTKYALTGAMGIDTARNVSAFRVFRSSLRAAFTDYRSPAVSIDVLLTWATSNFASVAVEHAPRAAGESGYSVYGLVNHAFNLMTGFSALPLRIASVLGFFFTLFGFGVLLWVLVRYFIGDGASVPGFAFLASIIAIFSGAQLFALGVFGEYLARMHFRTMEQPPYLVETETRFSENASG